MKKIFISGSITIKAVNGQIKTRLDNIINQNHTVLIGDANGADMIVQSYLVKNKYPNVNIYCSGQTCRNNVGNWRVTNVEVPANARGRNFYMVKDKQMALDSDYGFMLWDGKSAGTLNNLLNLVTHDKTGLVYLQSKDSFRTIKNINEFEGLIKECNQKDIDNINKKISFRKKLENYKLPVQEQLAFDIVSESSAVSYGSDNKKNKVKAKMARKATPKKQKSFEEN